MMHSALPYLKLVGAAVFRVQWPQSGYRPERAPHNIFQCAKVLFREWWHMP